MSKIKEPTLLQYYPVLKAKDKALILRALNEHRTEGQGEIHFGILPFVTMSRTAHAVYKMTLTQSEGRVWTAVAHKIEMRRWTHDAKVMRCYITLDPQKVTKRFGKRPDLGVTIPVIPKEHARGPLKWNIGAKAWQPEKILAAPRISLTLRGPPRLYELATPSRYYDLAWQWLMDNCE